jgi:DNA-binding transcriptional ArsR family regulator
VPRTRPPRPSLPEAADLFRLLGDPARLRLLLLLADRGEVCAGDLAAAGGWSPSVGAGHLMRLRLAGVVAPRREGHWVYYRLGSPFVAGLLRHIRPE